MTPAKHRACGTELTLNRVTVYENGLIVLWCPKCRREVDDADVDQPGPFVVVMDNGYEEP